MLASLSVMVEYWLARFRVIHPNCHMCTVK
jgi:hypothetical protein